jgi:hypothetical protein
MQIILCFPLHCITLDITSRREQASSKEVIVNLEVVQQCGMEMLGSEEIYTVSMVGEPIKGTEAHGSWKRR